MRFPNETSEYRAARDALLLREIALRRQMEAVATQLRALPVVRNTRIARIRLDGFYLTRHFVSCAKAPPAR
jgi:predicted dithiol-disulfide oxidoreductase (DUF899 family)